MSCQAIIFKNFFYATLIKNLGALFVHPKREFVNIALRLVECFRIPKEQVDILPKFFRFAKVLEFRNLAQVARVRH